LGRFWDVHLAELKQAAEDSVRKDRRR